MRTDISDEVRRRLPSPLIAALNEVEEVYGRQVPLYLVPDLGVTASGRADPAGFVELPPHACSNLNVIGEEIMHLHRWTRGYPAIDPAGVTEEQSYGSALRALGGYFDEYAFFPFLERAGLAPRSELEPWITETVGILKGGLLDRIPRLQESGQLTLEWGVKLTVTHVRAVLLCVSSSARDTLLELFDGTLLQQYAELGHRISTEIAQTGESTPAEVAAHMYTSLFTHLSLPENAAVIRSLFPTRN